MALSRRLLRHGGRGACLGIALYYAVWGGEYSAFDLRRLEAMRGKADVALTAQRVVVDSLRMHAARLDSSPEAIERLARERFGMIRDGEVLYRFVRVDTAASREKRVAGSP
jgi:cell division protein FtsB